MDDTYSQDNNYYNSWAYWIRQFRYNQSGIEKENVFKCGD